MRASGSNMIRAAVGTLTFSTEKKRGLTLPSMEMRERPAESSVFLSYQSPGERDGSQ